MALERRYLRDSIDKFGPVKINKLVSSTSVVDYLALHPGIKLCLVDKEFEQVSACTTTGFPKRADGAPLYSNNVSLDRAIREAQNELLEEARWLKPDAFVLGVNYYVGPPTQGVSELYATGIPVCKSK